MSNELRSALSRLAAKPSSPVDVEELWRSARRRRMVFRSAASCIALMLLGGGLLLIIPRPASVEFLPSTDDGGSPADDGTPMSSEGTPMQLDFEVLANASPGIRAGAVTYAATEDGLGLTWDRYNLPGRPPDIDWSRDIAVAFGTSGACVNDAGTIKVYGAQVRILVPTQPECLQQYRSTTFVLALPRQQLPGTRFELAVAAPDSTVTAITVDLVTDPAARIGALPPEGRVGREELGEPWPPLASQADLSHSCDQISEFLRTPLPYLPDPPAGLQPPDCYLESIGLGASDPDPGVSSWFAHVVYLPVDADPARDGMDVILDTGGLWYAVRFVDPPASASWPDTHLNEPAGGIVAIDIGGSRGYVQSAPQNRMHVGWLPDALEHRAHSVLFSGALTADEMVGIARRTEFGIPVLERQD